MKKISFNTFFKSIILLLAAYFLFLLTKIANSIEKSSEIGRFQFFPDRDLIIDSKTGKIYNTNRPFQHLKVGE